MSRRVLAAAMIVAMAVVALAPPLAGIVRVGLVPDFTMLWIGGRFALQSPSLVYDVEAVTAAQQWIRDVSFAPLPFVYPPTALLLLAPFGALPFWPAYILWTAAGAFVFWTAARRLVRSWAAPLSFLSPHVVIVLLLGQTTLFVGAAVLWSIALLRSRPVLAGALMGVAAAIKPQSAFLAPIAFVAGRNWIALAAAACSWLLLATASLVFGPALWFDWINALAAFPDMVAQWKLDRLGGTPSMMARFFGIDPAPFFVAGLAAGIAIVWIGSRSDDASTRALTFVSGTLLASPYAMAYELAMIAPVLVSAMLTVNLRGLITAAPLFALRSYMVPPALLTSVWAALSKRGRPGERKSSADVPGSA